jgi:hypothetical protein
VASNLRTAAARYAPQATVDACFAEDASTMVESGVTAFLCGSCDAASAVGQQLDRLHIQVPAQVSLMAIGISTCEPRCSGYFVPPLEKASAIAQLLGNSHIVRPTTIWLAGRFTEKHTVAPISAVAHEPPVRYRELAG